MVHMHGNALIRCMVVIAAVAVARGCSRPAAVKAPAGAASAPEQNEPPPPSPPDIPAEYEELLDQTHARWLHIEAVHKNADRGGWATGAFFQASNKIVIDTEGVRRFALRLDRIDIDWTRRVILRIDGYNAELTRKHFPTLRLQRSTGGSWIPAQD